MQADITPDLTREFLSSVRVCAKAVRDVFEAALLSEAAGDRITFQHLKLLNLIAHTDSVTIGDAATFLGVSAPAASKTVEKLVRRRLLRRSDTRGDRRSSRLSLTETSRRLLETYEAASNRKAAEIFAQSSAEELGHTAEVLDRLAAAIVSQCGLDAGICMQCEIYFRRECRFGDLGARKCFYRRHETNDRGVAAEASR